MSVKKRTSMYNVIGSLANCIRMDRSISYRSPIYFVYNSLSHLGDRWSFLAWSASQETLACQHAGPYESMGIRRLDINYCARKTLPITSFHPFEYAVEDLITNRHQDLSSYASSPHIFPWANSTYSLIVIRTRFDGTQSLMGPGLV